ncbi:Exocyst complex component SEC8 [Vitis vinifera]|uniref:Exocyst complex component Sec8 n=1 Tax=Vitis vinifera TaxID=29760 RepID=A0A438ILS5_VITVI|nr:Exocyst complex component SEC8 [Vitis vinifera]
MPCAYWEGCNIIFWKYLVKLAMLFCFQCMLGKASIRASNPVEENGKQKMHHHTRTSSAPPRNLASFADEYRKLAIDCLKVLRVEMQLETIFHMQEMTSREYLDDQDAEEPDDFIISLTAQRWAVVHASEVWWARIFDRNYSELLPRLLHVVVGLSCFAVQLWSEISTWVNRVVLRARELKVEEAEAVAKDIRVAVAVKEVGTFGPLEGFLMVDRADLCRMSLCNNKELCHCLMNGAQLDEVGWANGSFSGSGGLRGGPSLFSFKEGKSIFLMHEVVLVSEVVLASREVAMLLFVEEALLAGVTRFRDGSSVEFLENVPSNLRGSEVVARRENESLLVTFCQRLRRVVGKVASNFQHAFMKVRKILDVVHQQKIWGVGRRWRSCKVREAYGARRFSRRINDWELETTERYLLRLHGRRVFLDRDDEVLWTESKYETFFVKTLYKVLEPRRQGVFPTSVVWNS